MTLRLSDLRPCFEGVIPSVVATTAPDGSPNISYLSHVAMVDESRVALSNQFFSKTAANVQANPCAALLVLDPRHGAQYRLDIRFEESLADGPLFERMAADLRATSAQIGMAGVMRLRSVDVFRVEDVRTVRSPVYRPPPGPEGDSRLVAAAEAAAAIAEAAELGAAVDATLAGLERLGVEHALVLLPDGARERMVAVGGLGYARSGVGAEAPAGEGVIGAAAQGLRSVRVNDMSRVRRFGGAIEASSPADENRTRSIRLPGLEDAMSQLAIPAMAQGRLRAVLFAESRRRRAFEPELEAAIAILAGQLAAALALAETDPVEAASGPAATRPSPDQGPGFTVVHHAFDDSVFIDGQYLIKGVPGRLLVSFLKAYLADGRSEFSNREVRLDASLRLPDLKDNLETRLLLLQRRLDDKAAPVRIERPARGRIRLKVTGRPALEIR